MTPVLAYSLSVLGALLGLTCTARARVAATARRRAWFLLLAAWAIGGTGIWVMHFIAMLGFGVSGSEIRYDVPLTTASAVIAIGVVAVGLFTAGSGRPHPVKILLGGAFAGLGVASMHYTGMAAMQVNGTVAYDDMLVAASVAIAVVAATVALWFTVTVRKPLAIIASALVMGVAVTGMHYTGMYAMEVHLHATGEPLPGSSVFGLIVPIIVLVILVVVALTYAVLAAPTDEDRAGAAYLDSRLARPVAGSGPPAAAPDPVGLRYTGPRGRPAPGTNGRPGPGVNGQPGPAVNGQPGPGGDEVNGQPGGNGAGPRRTTAPVSARSYRRGRS